MVSLKPYLNLERSDRIIQSVDIAIGRLLTTLDDPIALASYLLTICEHKHALLNKNGLVQWGIAWVRQVLIEGKIGQRRDEEIASACLAALALDKSSNLPSVKNALKTDLPALLKIEAGKNKIPLRRWIYAVMVLLAAQPYISEDKEFNEIVDRTARDCINAVKGGRLFGLSLIVRLLKLTHKTELLRELDSRIRLYLNDPGVSYEDQLYLAQALWEMQEDKSSTALEYTSNILTTSPVWQYLMNGLENLPPMEEEQGIAPLSHLTRAALLDLVLHYQRLAMVHFNAQIDERYRGRAGVNIPAFGFFVLIFLIPFYFLLPPLIQNARPAARYWLVNETSVMPDQFALYYLGAATITFYLLILFLGMMPTLYSVFLKSQIGSGERVRGILLKKFIPITKWYWVTVMIFGVILAVGGNLGVESVRHNLKNILSPSPSPSNPK